MSERLERQVIGWGSFVALMVAAALVAGIIIVASNMALRAAGVPMPGEIVLHCPECGHEVTA